MAERNLNQRVMASLAGLDPVRVENPLAGPGTPDINFVNGWIEDKLPEKAQPPKRAATPIRVGHYTTQQRAWHVRRCAHGGLCLMVFELPWSGEVFIFDGTTAAQYVGNVPYTGLIERAALYMRPWNSRIFREFIDRRNPRQIKGFVL